VVTSPEPGTNTDVLMSAKELLKPPFTWPVVACTMPVKPSGMIHVRMMLSSCETIEMIRKLAESNPIVTSNKQLPVFPEESTVAQFTCVLPRPNVVPDVGMQLTGTLPSQLSTAEELNVTTTPLGSVAFVKIFPGQLITGAWLSTTITFCVQVALLPHESVAVQATEFVPLGKTCGALLTTVVM
jgi:hypothetical protein